MAYTWITPKTDWNSSTRFSYVDYNRIRNNLLYINDMLNNLYPSVAKEIDLGEEKTGYSEGYYISEFNAFEDALESFNRIGQDVSLGNKKTFVGNKSFIEYDECNRLESSLLKWYDLANPVISDITVSPTAFTCSVGDTIQFSVTVSPSSSQYSVTWISSDTSIATIDDNGLLSGVSEGKVTITIKIKQNSTVYTKTVNGTVSDAIPIPTKPIGLAEYDNKLWLIASSVAYTFDGSEWVWNTDLPNTYNNVAVATNSEGVHIFGGYYSGRGYYNSHYINDSNSWEKSTNLPRKMDAPESAVLNDKIYFAGSSWLGGFYVFENNAWSKIGALPYGFVHGNMVAYNGAIHIMGNYKNDDGTARNHYKWDGNVWSSESILPIDVVTSSESSYSDCAVYDNKIHLVVGSSHYTWDGSVWTQIDDLPKKLPYVYNNRLVVYNNELYVAYDDSMYDIS